MSNFGRVRSDLQSVFAGTGLIYGIQNFSIDNNFGDFSLKYLGFGGKSINETVNSAQYADLTIDSYLIQQNYLIQNDFFVSQTGIALNNFYILKNQYDKNPYSLVSGCLLNYSAKYTPNTIPQANATFRFYNGAGNISTSQLDSSVTGQLSLISGNSYTNFNGAIANSNYINLNINESTGNRVLDFTFGLSINRLPIYNIGNRFPIRTDILFPINVTCELTFEADPSFIDASLSDFPINKIQQNMEVDVFSNQTNTLMSQYKFSNMTLISNKRQSNVDGNLTIARSYIGQIFGTSNGSSIIVPNLDFGFVSSGVDFFLDWGFTNQTPVTDIDWGGI